MERFTRNNSGTLIDLTNKEDVGLLVKRSRSSTDNLAVSFLPCGDLEEEKFASSRWVSPLSLSLSLSSNLSSHHFLLSFSEPTKKLV